MSDLARLLNPEQLAAATAPDGPLLVLAAAGTGKTRTLVYRVAHLVDRGIDPRNILLLTFTNRAAREMIDRARDVVGERVGGVWGGTFHHVANRILRRHAPRIGYPCDFAILDGDEQRSLVGAVMKERKLTAKEFLRKEVLLGLFSGARNRQIPLGDFLETRLGELEVDPDAILRVERDYEARKTELRAMDFDDLLLNALKLLRETDEVRRQYQAQFRHVLVDEYQDTNSLQAEMVDLLAAGCGNLSVVGDDFQCIYTWRGADFRNIMEFPKIHPDARIVKLEQNYRSVPGILRIANACIAGNPHQFQKTLRPTRPAPEGLPRLVEVYNGAEQAAALVRLVREYRRQGYAYRDMAVLYRAHFHSIELQIQLAREELPHLITSGIGVFEQAHVKDMLCFFRLAENPTDRLAFERLVGLLKGAGPSTVAKLWTKLGGAFNAADPAQREALHEAMPARLRDAWRALDRLLAEYTRQEPRPAADTVVAAFLEGFYQDYLARQYDHPDERADDLRELALLIAKSGNTRGFLAEVALLTNVDHAFAQGRDRDSPADRLTLSTVHQAKGLEWPVVFIPWAVEGMFPSSRSLAENDAGDDAEERRLFYVAVTRARDDLVIFTPQCRETRDGGFYGCQPSRFVTEIPRNLLRSVSLRRNWY